MTGTAEFPVAVPRAFVILIVSRIFADADNVVVCPNGSNEQRENSSSVPETYLRYRSSQQTHVLARVAEFSQANRTAPRRAGYSSSRINKQYRDSESRNGIRPSDEIVFGVETLPCRSPRTDRG